MTFVTASGAPVGRVGQGTWTLGDEPSRRLRELASLRSGIEAGMNLLDTAEMYGEGRSEKLVGESIRPYDRAALYLVSKVYPHNAGRDKIALSCEASLRRLGTDYLDLYLLHWRGRVPLAETVEGMEALRARGLIRAWGVSNLDAPEMEELFSLPGGENCLTDQVLYHLGSRGIEFDLLPLLTKRGLPLMAYSPVAQGGAHREGLLTAGPVRTIARAHSATPTQVLLAFLLAQGNVVPIPRASRPEHALENAAAASLTLTPQELAFLNKAFPAPRHKVELEML
ncbi:MAG: aldo/keto reductase [bacterium]